MKSLKIMGVFICLFAIAMVISSFYFIAEDEEALIVFASFYIVLFISSIYMAIGLSMIFTKKKEHKEK